MRVYRVSPIVQYGPFYRLSYFSKLDFELGNVVEVDFNNRKILAVVTESLDMNDAKVEIRQGNFKTKKIEKRVGESVENFLNKKQFLQIQKFASEYVISVGEVMFSLFGNVLNRDSSDVLINYDLKNVSIYPDKLSSKAGTSSPLVKRREGDFLTGKKVLEFLENLRKGDKLKELEKIIIKDFTFAKYTGYQAPHISQLHLLFLYLEFFDIEVEVVLETNLLGISEKHFLENYKGSLEFELVENENNAKKFIYKKKEKDGKILDEEILEAIRKEKSFLFVLTSGFANRVYCKDCGESYACGNCKGSYKIISEEGERYLFCKDCKHKKTLKDDQYLICKKCGGWGLFPYGEGSQKVYEELLKNGFSKDEIIFADESVKKMGDKKIISLVRNFIQNIPPSELGSATQIKVLLGSKRVLKIIKELQQEKLQTVILSLGPLVKGKYFDSDEKFLQLLSEVENVSSKMYIGKNEGDEILLENFKDTKKFLENEIKLREQFALPPFNEILSFGFDYKNKRGIDIFFEKNINNKMNFLQNKSEIKKGRKIIYYWVLNQKDISENHFLIESLRGMGEIVISNFVYDQFF